jgi:Ca2+-binding RTX toxin-like protein
VGAQGRGFRTAWRVAALAAVVLATGTAQPAGAQEEPPPPPTVRASFDGGCADTSNPPGLVTPPTGASIDLVVPAEVQPGATVQLPVLAVDDQPGPLGREARFATLAVTGATPTEAETSALASTYSALTLTVTGAPGSVVELRLTSTSFAVIASIPDLHAGYACAAPGGEETTIRIPIAAPTCLGAPATLVAGADQPAVTGTEGDDVIVARAPGVVVSVGQGGDDLVCAEAGGGTLSYAGARHSVLARLRDGVARDGAGGSVRFTGIAGIDGSPRADALVGDDGPNVLRGGPGNDLLVGLGGPDVLDGQAGADLLIGDREDTCTSGIRLGCGGAGG